MRNFIFHLAMVALVPIAHAEEASNPPAPKSHALLLDNIATYAEHGNLSDAARSECNVDTNLPKAVEKFANEYSVPVALGRTDTPETASKLTARIQIDLLVGGKFSMSRWVISELGVSVTVMEGATEKMNTHFKCNAGPGVGFIYATACSRLDRCVEQIGAKTAKWLGLAARNFTQATPVETTATGPNLPAEQEK